MHVKLLIAAVLTLPGCSASSTDSCNPDTRSFDLMNIELTEMQVEAHGGRADATCEDLCRVAYAEAYEDNWELEISGCQLTLEPTAGEPIDIAGTVSCSGDAIEYYCVGRRPIGHVELAAGASLADRLAGDAHLEAASVDAFTQLAARLERWAAPAALVDRCRRAAADEARHADLMTALARSHGADVPAPRQRRVDPDLLTVALDNAVEGCVFEAWAAVFAAWVGRDAADPALRAAHAALADDEAEHAALAWDLHTWLIGQLDADGRDRVRAAQAAAIARLADAAAAHAHAAPPAFGVRGPVARARAAAFAAGLSALHAAA